MLCCMTIFLSNIESHAQEIIKDINPAPGALITVLNNASQHCFTCGDLVYFSTQDSLGMELWRTDGTSAGTHRVMDMNPGEDDGLYANEPVLCHNGTAYFRDISARIYKTDGTASGTVLVTNNMAGPYGLHIFNDRIYYIGMDQNLWSTSGIPGSEQIVMSFDFGDSYTPSFMHFAAGTSHLYMMIVIYGPSGTIERSELWKTDGTEGGTVMVKSFQSINKFPTNLIANGDIVYFNGIDNTYGSELWTSDGTEAGTRIVKDLNPGSGDANFYVRTFFNNQLIFAMDYNTWVSDGTAEGTRVLIPNVYATVAREYQSSLYLLGRDNASGEVYFHQSDATPEGTVALDALGSEMFYTQMIPVTNGKFIFPMRGADLGIELGVSNGAPGNSTLLKDINPGPAESSPRFFAELNGQVIFMADDGTHGYELWITDGTPEQTKLIRDVKTGTEDANIDNMNILNGKLLFLAGTNDQYRELWTSDATEAGTQMVYDFEGPDVIGKTDDHLVILDQSKFWKSDGTPGGTSIMWDMVGSVTGYGMGSRTSVTAANNLYFSFRTYGESFDLWRANTETNEVVRVPNSDPTIEMSFPYYNFHGAALGNELVFEGSETDHGAELWITSNGGTQKQLLKDINPGTAGSAVCCFASAGDKVFFFADDGVHGKEPWVTDGTHDGTFMLRDITTGTDWPVYNTPAILNGSALFAANGPEGTALWISDGTSTGTGLLKAVQPDNLVSLDGKVYFFAMDQQDQLSVYETDGTEAGTRPIGTPPAGNLGYGMQIVKSGNVVYFRSADGIWRTLGTPASTEFVSDFEVLSDLYPIGNRVLFEGRGTLGRELYGVEVTKFNQTITMATIGEKRFGDPSFEVNAFSSSGLPVTLSSTDDNILVDGTRIELLAPGRATITATQAGDDNSHPATPVSESFCIDPPKPAIAVDVDGEGFILVSSAADNNYWYRDGTLFNSSDAEVLVEEEATYTLTVTADDCESEPAVYELVFTGLEDAQSGLRIFPNPVNDVLEVHLPFPQTNTELLLKDMNGRIILHRETLQTSEPINVSELENGVYILQTITQNKITSRLFLKQ